MFREPKGDCGLSERWHDTVSAFDSLATGPPPPNHPTRHLRFAPPSVPGPLSTLPLVELRGERGKGGQPAMAQAQSADKVQVGRGEHNLGAARGTASRRRPTSLVLRRVAPEKLAKEPRRRQRPVSGTGAYHPLRDDRCLRRDGPIPRRSSTRTRLFGRHRAGRRLINDRS